MFRGIVLVLLLACGARMTATTIEGAAHNAKGGAVVVADDGRVVYVAGLEQWPAELDGQRVAVTGRVATEVGSAQPLVNDAGEYSAGAEGPQTTIRDATWRAVSR